MTLEVASTLPVNPHPVSSQQRAVSRQQQRIQLTRLHARQTAQNNSVGDLESGSVDPEVPRLNACATSELRRPNAKGYGDVKWYWAVLTPIILGDACGGAVSATGATGAAVLYKSGCEGFDAHSIKEIAMQNGIGGVVVGATISGIAILWSKCFARGAAAGGLVISHTSGVQVGEYGQRYEEVNEHPCSPLLTAVMLTILGVISSPIGIGILTAGGWHHTTQQEGFYATGVGNGIAIATAFINFWLVVCCKGFFQGELTAQ